MAGEDVLQYLKAINPVFFSIDKGTTLPSFLKVLGLKIVQYSGALFELGKDKNFTAIDIWRY